MPIVVLKAKTTPQISPRLIQPLAIKPLFQFCETPDLKSERLVLLGIIGEQLKGPLKLLGNHDTMVPRGLRDP